ncbi:hypothetical protein SynBIOSE41_01274 [Synechococcus sp. BIOS-E4-1]|nr:hypothetical protein [Synechococcus sp. BIOS-E4-1]QNI53793.1 hypothetical protein SynBIOSE41_01274 [Synechococcus sp. BIOS-E4-1]
MACEAAILKALSAVVQGVVARFSSHTAIDFSLTGFSIIFFMLTWEMASR